MELRSSSCGENCNRCRCNLWNVRKAVAFYESLLKDFQPSFCNGIGGSLALMLPYVRIESTERTLGFLSETIQAFTRVATRVDEYTLVSRHGVLLVRAYSRQSIGRAMTVGLCAGILQVRQQPEVWGSHDGRLKGEYLQGRSIYIPPSKHFATPNLSPCAMTR